MRARVCSAGHDVCIHAQPTIPVWITSKMKNPDHKFCTTAKKYKILYEGDSYPDAELALVEECARVHTPDQEQHGRFRVGHHKLANGMVQDVKIKDEAIRGGPDGK